MLGGENRESYSTYQERGAVSDRYIPTPVEPPCLRFGEQPAFLNPAVVVYSLTDPAPGRNTIYIVTSFVYYEKEKHATNAENSREMIVLYKVITPLQSTKGIPDFQSFSAPEELSNSHGGRGGGWVL